MVGRSSHGPRAGGHFDIRTNVQAIRHCVARGGARATRDRRRSVVRRSASRCSDDDNGVFERTDRRDGVDVGRARLLDRGCRRWRVLVRRREVRRIDGRQAPERSDRWHGSGPRERRLLDDRLRWRRARSATLTSGGRWAAGVSTLLWSVSLRLRTVWVTGSSRRTVAFSHSVMLARWARWVAST